MMTEFEKLVWEMREAQKVYYRLHDPLDLKKAKDLERKVDAALRAKKEAEQDAQPDLFGSELPWVR